MSMWNKLTSSKTKKEDNASHIKKNGSNRSRYTSFGRDGLPTKPEPEVLERMKQAEEAEKQKEKREEELKFKKTRSRKNLKRPVKDGSSSFMLQLPLEEKSGIGLTLRSRGGGQARGSQTSDTGSRFRSILTRKKKKKPVKSIQRKLSNPGDYFESRQAEVFEIENPSRVARMNNNRPKQSSFASVDLYKSNNTGRKTKTAELKKTNSSIMKQSIRKTSASTTEIPKVFLPPLHVEKKYKVKEKPKSTEELEDPPPRTTRISLYGVEGRFEVEEIKKPFMPKKKIRTIKRAVRKHPPLSPMGPTGSTIGQRADRKSVV